MADRFSEFVRALSVDPDTYAAFEKDPDSVLESSGLSSAEKALMKFGSPELLRNAVDPAFRELLRIPARSQLPAEILQTDRSSVTRTSGSLTIVGSGIRLSHITLEARHHIQHADRVFYVTADHATTHWIERQNPNSESLYNLYEPGKDRSVTYREMVERILGCVREGFDVCAVFYGHPGIFVTPSHEAIRRARAEGFPAVMLPAVSADACLIADVGIDPGAVGCQSFEATDFLIYQRPFDPHSLLILWQIGVIGVATYQLDCEPKSLDRLVSYLETRYRSSHEVIVYEASPYPMVDAIIQPMPLKDLPTCNIVTPISTLCIPPVPTKADENTMVRLRKLQA